jgi:DNA-directed RNA polymerase subunit RPC12/RpoP
MSLFKWLHKLYLKWYKPGMKAYLQDKWEVSMVQCDLCSHRWIAVRPKGLDRLECPNCSNMAMFENIKTDNKAP